ncbi:Rieske (2Fe-2S) protein [Alicyclobacillus kakegawensis]|uniref:Rieske (2Fe-2S) protein n=1 Tax=Alicyclobacillus kakegawensis TaxID=392012 RepID=UPI0008372FBE|nr:Rieske (2Fe-2S) protein [Alicyclobacillus kakegawensis]
MPCWVECLAFDHVQSQGLCAVCVDGRDIVLAAVGDQVFALDNRCSHADCALSEGMMDGYAILCPCHGSEFDLRTGEVLNPPAKRPVATYRTKVEDGRVWVQSDRAGHEEGTA